MATFKYTAFDENEKNLKGFINASDSDEARLILINRGLNPLNIEKTLQKRSKVRISNNNLSIFTKQMSALLSAGTPIEKCLVLLSKQSSNSKFSQILLSINEDITEGNSLSSSMKKYPSIFDEIYTSTIYAGETSASLSEVFHDLSIYLDKEAKISFVPTPSTLEINTGSLYLLIGKLKHPPNEPISDKVYLLNVDLTCFLILDRPSLATSISTPASL